MTSGAVSLVIKTGNQVVVACKAAYIFRSTLGYVSHQVADFLGALSQLANATLSDSQTRAFRQVGVTLSNFVSLVGHLKESKWIQPALNWPVISVHRDVAAFRTTMQGLIPALGLADAKDFFAVDEALDKANRKADLNRLKASLQSLIAQVNTSDAVGVQQQIETKLIEISKHIPQGTEHRKSEPSYPSTLMKKRVEELLEQFKSINIENENLKIMDQIGVGGFGAVWKAVHLATSEVVAVKELRGDRLTMVSWASLYSEVETMAQVKHPYVLELVGAHIKEPFRIITSYKPGKSLFDRLHRVNPGFKPLDSTKLTILAFEVAEGMRCLHRQGIVHRDLKTQNILLDGFDDGCVADFGLSGVMKDNQDLVGGVGTPHYTAPEILQHMRYNEKVDVYSYAVVLWEMLTRKVPYSEMTNIGIYDHIVNKSWRLPIPKEAPDGLRKLITRCWSRNPADRPCFEEIVQQFIKHEIYFPRSKEIDFSTIMGLPRCPPIDIEYAFKVLENPSDPNFASVCHFIASRIDERTRKKLRTRNLVDKLMESKQTSCGILVLAGVLLDESEIAVFLEKGGMELFKDAINSGKGVMISAALRFSMVVPKDLLHEFKDSLPILSSYLESHSAATNYHIVQFFARFPHETIAEYRTVLAKALVGVGSSVDNQKSFNIITDLFSLCIDEYTSEEIKSFHQLLKRDFVVPASFVSSLLQRDDSDSYAEIVLDAFRAAKKSDLNEVLIDFLLKCSKTEQKIFDQIWTLPDFIDIITKAVDTNAAMAAVFLVFCIAPRRGVSEFLVNSPLLGSLIQMKGFTIQRLQIFTILCINDEFCAQTSHMDGIVHLLVFAFASQNKGIEVAALSLIGAFSKHKMGCEMLIENGILDVFAQRFLSSNSGYNPVVHEILRNVSANGIEIPQGSLIISCLMQDLVVHVSNRTEILFTIVKLAEIMPDNVQEYDLLRIVNEYMSHGSIDFVLHGLRLLSVIDPVIFRNMHSLVLSLICKLLNTHRLLIPNVIEAALDVLVVMAQQYDIREFLIETDFMRYLDELMQLYPSDSDYLANLSATRNILSDYVQ